VTARGAYGVTARESAADRFVMSYLCAPWRFLWSVDACRARLVVIGRFYIYLCLCKKDQSQIQFFFSLVVFSGINNM